MRRCFFALIAICFSAPTQADEPAHPGILLGTGIDDIVADIPYGPIKWCGELLFLQTESGPELIDPATRAVVSRNVPEAVRHDPFGAGLLGCTKAGGETVLWFDDGVSVVWQSIDGSDVGTLRGIARPWGTPLFDMNDRIAAAVPKKGGTLVADRMPGGMKLLPISTIGTEPRVPLDHLDGFVLLRDDLVALVSHGDPQIGVKELVIDHGQIIGQGPIGLTTVIEIDLDQGLPRNRHSVTIQELLPSGRKLEFPDLTIGADNEVHFMKESDSVREDCKLIGLSWGAPKVVCERLPADFKTQTELILEKVNTDWALISPSGRWAAWDEWFPITDDDSVGRVTFYVAPMAGLLESQQ